MNHSFDKDYWDQIWTGERAGSMGTSDANPHLIQEVGGLPPGSAIDAGCGAHVLQREEPGAVGGVETGPCDELPSDFVPAEHGSALPPPGDVRLLGGPGRAGGPAQALDLVELRRPLLAAEGGRWRRAELRGALDEERPHVARPRGRVEHWCSGRGQQWLPVPGRGVRHPRRRPEPPVALSRVEHCLGCCVSHRDALALERVVVDRVERGRVRGGERAQECRATGEGRPLRCRRDQLREHVVGSRRDRSVDRRPRTGASVEHIWTMLLRPDGVDRVVDRPLHHAHVDRECRWSAAVRPRKRAERRRRDLVPVGHLAGVGPRGCCGRSAGHAERTQERTDAHRDDRDRSAT